MIGSGAVQELQEDLNELEIILKTVTRSNVRRIIADEISSLKNQKEALEKNIPQIDEKLKNKNEKSPTQLYTSKITSYGFDESSKFVKLYINIKNCNKLSSDQATCDFTDSSFKLTVSNHDEKNHQLQILRLAYKINPEKSTCKVKPDNIVLSLKKVEEGKTWGSLLEAERKAKEAKDAETSSTKDMDSSDPQAGIMNMMKKMYNDGDDDMKRMIKKTWYESQQKQGAGGEGLGSGLPNL